ncbi:MFS transporter [Pantoea piersonii]|jgi:EmrB/QacA subfamily drug resistance transporter|uniref:MFS transporter n=1 Tax=Pantoea piersonii TaxID=2364647 RepID=UPI000EA07890|nr:MFS transporter [Pantoea piersonii]MBZ6386768.1 MFS transporter [Pantoea piersonii]MBZ6400083.1 MFS transporter [Pantoea piersonii]MBZ6410085.1 MFS transporter [Pantoea piersonii]MBZ6426134.1 MFS transporter [Pantoea piersonii]NYB04639.1 MFS transporter [Pantoea piersonii]
MNYRVRVASVYLLGFFIDLVNMFIASVAYPEIGRCFEASVNQLAWISNSYILGLTMVIPLSSWLARRIGTKRLFMISLFIFIAGTCGVGMSSSVMQLIALRLLQGIGGGLLIPVGQTMTYALYRSHERAKLSSVVMLVALLAPALSPAVGGLLVQHISWRWVFLASLPLAILALVLAGCWLKADKQLDSKERLDLAGLITGCSALTLILLGLTYLGDSNHFEQGALVILLGFLCLGGYVWSSLNKNKPLLNLRLVKNPLLQAAMLIYQFVPGVFTGVSMLTMLYLQNQLGMHASLAGAMMLPWSLASFAAISLTGKRFNCWGPRPLFITGCLVHAFGIVLLALTGHGANEYICIFAFTLMGFGGSLCSSTAQSSAFIQIADSELADASALWNINRQLSFSLGVTLVSLLFNLIADTNTPAEKAYHLCFVISACSAVIPVLCCLRIANQKVITALNQEQK